MDRREANLPEDHNHDSNLYRSFNASTSSSSSSFSSSSPDFLRDTLAAFKRHRMMPQLNNFRPRRLAVRQGTLESSGPIIDSKTDESHNVSVKQGEQDSSALANNMIPLTTANQDSSSVTPPSISAALTEEAKFKSIDAQRDQPTFSCDCKNNNSVDMPCLKCNHIQPVDGPKKVQFALGNDSNQLNLQTAPSHETVNSVNAPISYSTTHISHPSQQVKEGTSGILQDPTPIADKSTNDSNVKSESLKSGKQEKPNSKNNTSAPRKRNYDPDLFFKVNGKLYQRLGKIGSGGSSEVHKVISQECTIYALKKIKLKGRDYATAYGFCQEIEYLNKLKGKDHIIQLIDYEVTDKGLLKEVLSGCMSNKDGRVKEDGCIYMVLEYGEIDLAHMLSHKWSELDGSMSTIDENWLRFYWQQILLGVKTIHEERIVHSDLKPANFLLVRGSLKLIDFGIAKAIMSDTTNIQRDSQVGTLSYMSPEAFMCNETDSNGNIIKCGRPSDIWSLGCILYQMVYGHTPFADYATFWAKFKVITDPHHKIHYQPSSNPWLIDLMKKCLAWDRKERWTIPQLLQHPFLVPPIPSPRNLNLIELVLDSCGEDRDVMVLCSRLRELMSGDTLNDACKVFDEMSRVCIELKERLG